MLAWAGPSLTPGAFPRFLHTSAAVWSVTMKVSIFNFNLQKLGAVCKCQHQLGNAGAWLLCRVLLGWSSPKVSHRLLSLAMTTRLSLDEALIRGYQQEECVCPHTFDQGSVLVASLSLAGLWKRLWSSFAKEMRLFEVFDPFCGQPGPRDLDGLELCLSISSLLRLSISYVSSFHWHVWADPDQAILHHLLGWSRNPSIHYSYHLWDHHVSHQASQVQLPSNHRRRLCQESQEMKHREETFSVVLRQKFCQNKIQKKVLGLQIGTSCLGKTGMGALCSGFVLEVLGVLCNPVLHDMGGSCCMHALCAHLFLSR